MIIWGVLILAAIGWVWRYRTLNSFFATCSNFSKKEYSMTEEVFFENDFIEWEEPAYGYSIRVKKAELKNYQDVIRRYDLFLDTSNPLFEKPEKLMLVTIQLRNINSNVDGIFLTDFILRGIDNTAYINWGLLVELNPILNGSYGISIKQGSECELLLPFNLFEMDYAKDTWENIENYDFWFRVTAFPTQKEIYLSLR